MTKFAEYVGRLKHWQVFAVIGLPFIAAQFHLHSLLNTDFDMARFISGKEVKEVFAKASVKVDPEIGLAGDVDTAVIILTFEDDSVAVIDNCRKAAYGYDQRLEVFGSKGMAQAENNFLNNHKLYTEEGVSGDLPLHFFLERYDASYNQ